VSGDLAETAVGCIDSFGLYAADVYIVAHGSIDVGSRTQLAGTPVATITSDASEGLFTDEILGWAGSSRVPAGADYDIIVDECTDGYYDPGADLLDGAGTDHGAFSVSPATADAPLPDLTKLKELKEHSFRSDLDSWTNFAARLIQVNEALNLASLAKKLKTTVSAVIRRDWMELVQRSPGIIKIPGAVAKEIRCGSAVVGPDLNQILNYVTDCMNEPVAQRFGASLARRPCRGCDHGVCRRTSFARSVISRS
jgi:hypothetical protein